MSNKTKVTQPHDKLVKKLLSNPTTAKDILSLYLPEKVRSLIDLNHLVLQRDSFIDDEHRAFAVDLLFKTTFAKEEGYLWILLEHQRKDDPWLPVRIFVYMGIIWDHVRRSTKSKKIPLVYPLIIFNGDRPYSHTLTFEDMIEPEASKELFRHLFSNPFTIIDLAAIQDEVLRKQAQDHVSGVALLMTIKHVFAKNFQSFFENVLLDAYKKLDRAESRDDLADLLYYLLNEAEFTDKDRFWSFINQEFSSELEEKVVTIAQELKAEGMKKGLEKGIQQGIEKGLEQGMEKGIEKGIKKVARNLIKKGSSLKLIAEATGLTIEEIKKLKDKAKH